MEEIAYQEIYHIKTDSIYIFNRFILLDSEEYLEFQDSDIPLSFNCILKETI